MQKFGRLGILLMVIHLFLFQLSTTGQNKKLFILTGKIVPEVTPSENGMIEMSKGGAEPTKIEIPKNGRFRLELEYFNEFTLTFMLKGHFSKTITVSTDIPQEVWERDNDFPPFPMIVQLFKEIEGIDKSFTLKASGKIFYGKQTDNFEKESIFNDIQIAEQIASAALQAGQVKKEVQTITRQESQDLAAMQKSFDQAVSEADVLYKRGEFQPAFLKYKEAHQLFPERVYPNDRIAELQDLVKALENTEKQKEELELKYKNAIARANGLFDQKTYQKARPGYEEALQYKPGDAYANARIVEIDQLLAMQAKQKQFDDLVAQADNNYKDKKLDQAVALYNQAKLLIPENEYPQKQINLINEDKQQMVLIEEQEKAFTQTIKKGDDLAREKDYIEALNSYRLALELKPDNKLASEKIDKMNQEIAIIERDKKYQETILQADQAFASKDLEKAKMFYQDALKLKSAEAYPTNQLAEINVIQTNETIFIELLANAEKAVAIQAYDESLDLLTQALKLKPKDPSVQNRMDEISILKTQQIADTEFDLAIQRGDQQKSQQKYDQAISHYRDALKIKPNNEATVGKISEVEQLLADLEKQKQYLSIILQADKSFDTKDYLVAQSEYQKALALRADEPHPTNRIKEIESIIDNEKQARLLDENYSSVIARADKSFQSESYADARKIYSEALTIKPNETYPGGQIAKIDEIMAEKARLLQFENEFLAWVEKGDAGFDQKNYQVAKTNYSAALDMKSNSTEVKAKIKTIDTLLQQIADDKKKEEEDQLLAMTAAKEKAYSDAIAKGNKQVEQKAYPEARSSFEEAQKLKPEEKLPIEMIARIDSLVVRNERELADARLKEEAFQKSLQEAQDNSFNEAMAKADKAFSENDFKTARTGYQTALTIKATDQTARQKLGETEAKLAGLAQLTQAYNLAINVANKNVVDKQYKEAKEKYEEALQYLPDSDYPKRQIEKLNELLGQAEAERQKEELYASKIKEGETLFVNKDYLPARTAFVQASEIKPSEVLPVRRIKEIDKLLSDLAIEDSKNKATQSAYQESIKRADQKFEAKEYIPAQLIYGEALAIKPNEQYPKNRIAEIDKLLVDLKIQQYNKAIESGDLAFKADQLEEATTQYELALTFKPNDQYARQQLSEIGKRRVSLLAEKDAAKKQEDLYKSLMAEANIDFENKTYQNAKVKYQNASLLKPAEALPKERIAQIDELLKELANAEETDRLYEESIIAGQLAFDQNRLIEARDAYQTAHNLKGFEPMPPIRIAELNSLIDKEEKIARQKALEEAQRLAKEKADRELYNKAILLADRSFAATQYLVSRIDYTNALSILPNEQYPQDQINKIDQLIAQQNDLNQSAKLKAMKDSIILVTLTTYNQLMAAARELENSKQYKSAILKYREAIEVQPDERENIEKLIASLEAKIRLEETPQVEIEPAPVVTTPVFNPAESEIATEARAKSYQIVSNYEEMIRKADDAFGIKDYSVARFYYYKANETKPTEEYPRNQVELIRKLVDSEMSSVDRSGYLEAIALADAAFEKQNYTIAKFYYYKALGIKSWEKYPKDRIQEINALTNSLLSEREEQIYRDLIARADEAYTVKDISVARFYYNKAISMKTDENYPRIKIKDIQKLIDQDRQDQQNLVYNQLVEMADQAMQSENFSIARFNYNKALGMKPNEKYPKDQLKRIKEALEKESKE